MASRQQVCRLLGCLAIAGFAAGLSAGAEVPQGDRAVEPFLNDQTLAVAAIDLAALGKRGFPGRTVAGPQRART